MADKMKADKISAARKKLKQFQSKTKTETVKSGVNSDSSASEQNGNSNRTNSELVASETKPNMNFDAFDPIESSNANRIKTSSELNSVPAAQEAIVADLSVMQFHQPNQSNPIEANPTINAVANGAQLEGQNQELANLLQMEKLRNHELGVKVTQQHAEIEKLRSDIGARSDTDSNAESTIDKLRHDLNTHIQTVNVLVGEKADLMAKLLRCQQQNAEFESANIELQGRLNASRHRVNELEKDLTTLEKSHQKYDGSQQALCTELETLQEDNRRLSRLKQEACDETAEVQHQLQLKAKEIDELKSALSERTKELDMTRLRLEQMTAGDLIRSEVAAPTESQAEQQKHDAERQIIELQNMVSELTGDRDRTQQQYQTYVQHLTKESTALQQRVQELSKSNEKLAKREQSLVQHISELERQFQKQISTQQRLAALRDGDGNAEASKQQLVGGATISGDASEAVNALQIKFTALEKERNDLNALIEDHSSQNKVLRQQIIEKQNKVAELEANLDRLRCETPNTTEILATIESDKVAASRAVAQNQALKQQLDEIQKAYVQVSNDKLELTDRLQSEQHSAREINHRFADVEKELSAVKEKLHFKDEEMIRLAHENTELNKQHLQLSLEVDRLRHYDATSNEKTTASLHHQLSTAKQEIRRLSAALKELEGKCDTNEPKADATQQTAAEETNHGGDCEHSHEDHDHQHHSTSSFNESHEYVNGVPCADHVSDRTPTESATPKDTSDVVSVCSTINIATNEAMDKLQDRFRRTMNEIADLTEEKQRLEHLVMQLQSETETIGEYIALYQTQRRLLKQRELEKDIQLHRIAADRTEMKEKLKQLNGLVELLLIQKGFNNSKEIMDKLNTTATTAPTTAEPISTTVTTDTTICNPKTGSTPFSKSENDLHAISEVQKHCTDHFQACTGTHDNSHNHGSHWPSNTQETATKIINLLSEIKDKNLNQDYSVVPNSLHHCSCCSGKLEVV